MRAGVSCCVLRMRHAHAAVASVGRALGFKANAVVVGRALSTRFAWSSIVGVAHKGVRRRTVRVAWSALALGATVGAAVLAEARGTAAVMHRAVCLSSAALRPRCLVVGLACERVHGRGVRPSRRAFARRAAIRAAHVCTRSAVVVVCRAEVFILASFVWCNVPVLADVLYDVGSEACEPNEVTDDVCVGLPTHAMGSC